MIGVIGCGNMASAIVNGIYSEFKDVKFKLLDRNKEKALELASAVDGQCVDSFDDFSDVDFILIGCKPQQFSDLANTLKSSKLDLGTKHIISMMASVPLERISKELGSELVTRIMPNTPIFYQKGVCLMLHSNKIQVATKQKIKEYFTACSYVYETESEVAFNQITTVTGSGPAYVYQFANSFIKKLVSFGLKKDDAQKLVIGLFDGASELMKRNASENLEDLIAKVTSKGGVTIEAVRSFEEDNLDASVSKAIDKAYKRSEDLSNE